MHGVKRELGRLESESHDAANEAPTCALPMHAPQISSGGEQHL